jgi:hypothetical protein
MIFYGDVATKIDVTADADRQKLVDSLVAQVAQVADGSLTTAVAQKRVLSFTAGFGINVATMKVFGGTR